MQIRKKLFIKTYGCQQNEYDSIKIQELMATNAYDITDQMSEADMIALNTCHIREKATEKLYSELGRVKKAAKDDALIVVAGCVGQAEGDEIFKRNSFVDIVVGPQSYHNLPQLAKQIEQGAKHAIELDFIEEAKFDMLPEASFAQGPSGFVSIQEGCDKFCTFCCVPYTRGAEFSRPPEQIYREALMLASKGSKEIYLLGQNVSGYHGKNSEGCILDIADLANLISNIPMVERIRYTTSHPMDMNDKLVNMHKNNPKIMPFLHLPVQSGSNNILKLMNRKYTRQEYIALITKYKIARPDIQISSDFIVGFPGESDEDFDQSLDLAKELRFIQSFSYKYSPRPGTPAALKEQIPDSVKSARLAILQKQLVLNQMEFNVSCIGTIMPVLFTKDGRYENQIIGKSPYMQSVYINIKDKSSILGKIVNIRITEALENSLTGVIH